jgi:hypothetical protein
LNAQVHQRRNRPQPGHPGPNPTTSEFTTTSRLERFIVE